MKCLHSDCGEKLDLIVGHEVNGRTTMIGFTSPDGHNHDDNETRYVFECPKGHKSAYSLINKCSECEWRGESENSRSHKVEEWPDYVKKQIEEDISLKIQKEEDCKNCLFKEASKDGSSNIYYNQKWLDNLKETAQERNVDEIQSLPTCINRSTS